jgi:hypothetical protein
MRIKISTKYLEPGEYLLCWDRYVTTGNVAMVLRDADSGELAMMCTLNPGDSVRIADPYVALKVYSENEGIEGALINAGIIEPPLVGEVIGRDCVAPIYKLTDAAWNDAEKAVRQREEDK